MNPNGSRKGKKADPMGSRDPLFPPWLNRPGPGAKVLEPDDRNLSICICSV
jgi:hypothetical protein